MNPTSGYNIIRDFAAGRDTELTQFSIAYQNHFMLWNSIQIQRVVLVEIMPAVCYYRHTYLQSLLHQVEGITGKKTSVSLVVLASLASQSWYLSETFKFSKQLQPAATYCTCLSRSSCQLNNSYELSY